MHGPWCLSVGIRQIAALIFEKKISQAQHCDIVALLVDDQQPCKLYDRCLFSIVRLYSEVIRNYRYYNGQ